MREITFSIRISPEEYLRYYRGSARSVVVTTDAGLRVEFPASVLQRFVTHEGVRGSFSMRFDEHNRFREIRRI